MSTLNDADLSGGKPATDSAATSMDSNSNTNIFGATSTGADSSFALLQQVQTILLENNESKARMMELENQVATFQKDREEWVSKLEESQKSSNQTIENIQQQLSQKEEEWAERHETQEKDHESSLKILQDKLDEWESKHQEWTTRENEFQENISSLEESKSQLETKIQQLEADVATSRTEASQLREEQADALKAHEETLGGLNIQIESLKKDLEAQGLQNQQDQQSYQSQENELQQTLDELRASVQEKDTLVQSLEGTIEELRLEASQLKQDHQTQVQDMEATIGNLEQENVAQSQQAEEYQTQIEKLQQEMDSLNSVFLEQQKKQAEQKQEEEKQDDDQQQERQEEQEDSKWQELVQSLQIQVQAQTNIAETKGQELEDSKSQNMQLRVQLQVLTQQKEQLEKNWTETKEQLKVLGRSQSNAMENDDSPQDQQVNQDQAITNLTEENKSLNERIVQMEAQLVLGSARGFDHSESKEDHNDHGNKSNDDTIAQLQQRIMHLVEEKLILQTAVETLEHQLMESNLLERNATSLHLQEKPKSPAASMKEYWQSRQPQVQQQQQPLPTIVVDENTKQADIIRQTLYQKKSQKLSHRISNTVLGTPTVSKPIQQIDVKATERLFLERRQKQELSNNKTENTSGQPITNLSNPRPTASTEIGRSSWIRSRDHGLTSQQDPAASNNNKTDLPGYTASNQHGFIKSAMRSSSSSSSASNKKEKTTTWTRIRDTIAKPKNSEKSETKTEPASADDFSLWVQELNHEQSRGGGKEESKQVEEFKSLSEPASMLDSLPASSNPLSSTAGRYAVQTLDDLLNGGADAVMAEGLSKKKNGKQKETRGQQTYRVADPNKKKPKKLSQGDDAKALTIGEGHSIDQSSLLGFYVHKQKEAANATTIGYLSNIIYGDPVEEEAKMQRKLLKRHLARKKKQEQKEREQLGKQQEVKVVKPVKKPVQPAKATITTTAKEPQTVFSSFI